MLLANKGQNKTEIEACLMRIKLHRVALVRVRLQEADRLSLTHVPEAHARVIAD